MHDISDTVEPLPHENIPDLYQWPLHASNHINPWVRCNMVMSLDGAVVDAEGKSAGIGTEADKRVFLAVRRDSDVILVGAGTARTEGYRPTTVPIALVTNHLHVEATMPLFADASDQSPMTYIFTTERAISQAPDWINEVATLISCGETTVDLPRMMHELHQLGFDRIHCEGGPMLLTSLLSESLLDELLLTVTPVLMGGGSTMITTALGKIQGEYTQVRTDEGTVLMRFTPRYSH
jgi:riboflavin-specific deaminase-like protein